MKSTLLTRWQNLSPREQTGLKLSATLLLAALVWALLLQPVWRLWQVHEQEGAALEQQRQQMVLLQAQAQALQKRTPLSRDEALRTLQALTRQALPAAQLAAQTDRVSISFKAASAASLATWLQSIRENAQVRVLEAQWQRGPEGFWEGAMVLQLPMRKGQP